MRKKRKAPFCFLIGSIPRKMPSLSNHSQKMLFTFKDLPGGCKAHDDEKHIWDCAFFDSEWTWKDLAGNLARSCSVLKSTAERQQRKTWNKPLLGGFQPIFNLDSDSLHKNWKDQVKNQISLKQADGVSLFLHFFWNNSIETTLQRAFRIKNLTFPLLPFILGSFLLDWSNLQRSQNDKHPKTCGRLGTAVRINHVS